MHGRNRSIFAASALAAALVVMAPAAGAVPLDGAGLAGQLWAWVGGWWAEVSSADEAYPNLDPNGAEAYPNLDPDGEEAEASPNLDPDGAEASPNLDPNG